MSYSLNYKALCLYYKIKAFIMVRLSCSVVSRSVDNCDNFLVLRIPKKLMISK